MDLSCYEILGRWLLKRNRNLLYEMARDGRTIWEQRIGIVSTLQFIRHGELEAELFPPSTHVLASQRPLAVSRENRSAFFPYQYSRTSFSVPSGGIS